MVHRMAVMAGLIALTPLAAGAQGIEARGIEVWVGYGAWAGDEVDSVDPGAQIGIASLLETAPHVAFGAEVYLGRYQQLDQDVDEVGINGLLRYSLGPRSGLHVYLQGRVGWSRPSAGSLSQDGFVVGPELGIEVPFSRRVRLVLAGLGTWRTYEDVRLGTAGVPLGAGGASGYQYGARLGVSVGEIF